jgi:hypothetical protein
MSLFINVAQAQVISAECPKIVAVENLSDESEAFTRRYQTDGSTILYVTPKFDTEKAVIEGPFNLDTLCLIWDRVVFSNEDWSEVIPTDNFFYKGNFYPNECYGELLEDSRPQVQPAFGCSDLPSTSLPPYHKTLSPEEIDRIAAAEYGHDFGLSAKLTKLEELFKKAWGKK